MRYAWITEHRDDYPVKIMCRVLEVSTSGYYDSIDRPLSARATRHEKIKRDVAQVYDESYSIYGSINSTNTTTKSPSLATPRRRRCVN